MKTGMNGMNAVADDDDVISLGMVGGVVQLRSSFPSSLITPHFHWLAVRAVPLSSLLVKPVFLAERNAQQMSQGP